MDAEWIKSSTAQRIFAYWADVRPAWLWSQDGTTLLWHNAAARYFGAKLKKSGLRLAPEAVPIRGQVSRLVRLGAAGRASLSRVQFLAGDKAISATCSCTPLSLANGDAALLLASVDPIEAEVRAAAGEMVPDAMATALFPPWAEYLLIAGGHVSGTRAVADADRARLELQGVREADAAGAVRFDADANGAVLLVYPAASATPRIAEVRAEEGVSADAEQPGADEQDLASTPEPMLPLGLEPVPHTERPLLPNDEWVEPLPAGSSERQLSSLFDRLAEDQGLYTTLTAADETFAGPPAVAEGPTLVPADEPVQAPLAGEAPVPEATGASDLTAELQPAKALAEPGDEPTAVEPAAAAEAALPGETLPAAGAVPLAGDMIATIIHYADEVEAHDAAVEEPLAPAEPFATLEPAENYVPADAPGTEAEAEVHARTPEPAGTDATIGAPMTEAEPEGHADAPAPELPEPAPPVAVEPVRTHWMITGRGFRKIEQDALADAATPSPPPADQAEAPAPPVAEPPPPAPQRPEPVLVDPADAEAVDRVSRYNFEELGRILTDRVSGEARPEPAPRPVPRMPVSDGVISLNAETLVLNRLPLAILVFRDQQVLFANRALTDLLGHESVEGVRAAGIASIFPAEGAAAAGPVNQLVRRDGTLLGVTARLQSVSWQGRAALMLSAAPAEPVRGHEGAVRAFAEIAAEVREEGFVAADRAGVVTQLSGFGSTLLGRPAAELIGKPLAILVDKPDMEPLRKMLEQPARFAETTRPSFTATTEDGNAELTLFAEGQAGIVTGYFGFLKPRVRVVPPVTPDDSEPAMLARLSRSLRRPLNTVVGFADLIGSNAASGNDTHRHAEYARDIRTAGLEIAVLVDELDDLNRLRDGRYAPRPADVDLQTLLEQSLARIKTQAGAARVLVRSAISERLPRIRADRGTLGQALLNLLASAVDQTPVGGSVILSAQAEEDGRIAIHVRDGAAGVTDLGERFVVFRDGVDQDGEQLTPVRSSVGLALTRSLLAVNACSLSVDPTAGVGTLFSMLIPADLVVTD